jgi:hypothetical protein
LARREQVRPFRFGDKWRSFQFGDLRKNLLDRIVVVEAEGEPSKSLSNLVKYWPAARSDKWLPILLLHVFARPKLKPPDNSPLILWDFAWREMKKELWNQAAPKLFARPFIYTKGTYEGMEAICAIYKNCLTDPLEKVCREVFDWTGPASDR